ncbi:MAG: hypothetical protein QOG04_1800 [Actinomycetota bacterium]|nr:hypothetical protein [Actinomycetota bacterium]
MRKTINIVLAGAILLAIPAVAGASRARSASGEYNTVTLNTDELPSAQGRFSNGVSFPLKPGERFVSVVVTDEHADKVLAVVGQDLDGDGVDDSEVEICGSSMSPIKVKPGFDVTVWVQEGTCEDGAPSTPTFGTVEATFTR